MLRRIKKAGQRQDWFGLELLVVVAGIVIGFQVTAWGSEQAGRRVEQELLRGLHKEFSANLNLYDQTAREDEIGPDLDSE